MKSSETNVASCVGMIIYSLISIPLTMGIYGWSLSKMWLWFVVPVFHLPLLSVAYAIGVASTIRLITYQSDADTASEDESSAWETLIKGTLKSLFLCGGTLVFGYIVKQFV